MCSFEKGQRMPGSCDFKIMRNALISGLFIFLAFSANAQEGFFSGFTLRKSFQSKTSSADPAIITFLSPEGKTSSWLLNGAIGYNILENNSAVLELSPYIEYNRNTLIEKEQNNWQIGFSSEWQPLDLLEKGWSPVFIGVVKFYDDQVKGNTSFQGNFYFTPVFKGKGLQSNYFWIPNNTSNFGNILQFSYSPHFGFENENRINTSEVESSGSIYRMVFRITATISLFPLNENLREKFELNTDLQYRNNLSESVENIGAKEYTFFTAGVNYLLFSFEEGKRVAKIGIDYTKGENPTNNFENQAFYALSLKLKL